MPSMKTRKSSPKRGLVNLRFMRPFPAEKLFKTLKNAKRVAVLDRSFSGNQGGILAQEIKSALYNAADILTEKPPIHGFVAGLGGRDITVETIEQIFTATKWAMPKGRHYLGLAGWMGAKDEY